MRETTEVGGGLPGSVEWVKDGVTLAIVRCAHGHPETVLEAAYPHGADMEAVEIVPAGPGVYRATYR